MRNFAGLRDRIEKKQMDKQKEEFLKEIEFMANKQSFTLLDFRQKIYDGYDKLKKGKILEIELTLRDQSQIHERKRKNWGSFGGSEKNLACDAGRRTPWPH